jgi:CheY-like chemotaxis protein
MQIFTNLISNALKFTYQGTIEFGFNFSSKQQLEFYVSDTGIGIPKDKHEVIFERFIQLNLGTSRYSGGNGLGLAITKGLVKMLGGSIWLQSEIEKGSTFYFTIKTILESDISDFIEKKIEDIKVDSIKGKTVLIVEDDEYNKALIKEILDNQGFNLIFADNGLDSVQMCLTTPIDLVLMDIGLPDISGYEAIKQILSNNPKLKIIAQTAYASPIDKNKTIQSGCIDYISKPLKSNGLIEIIKKHL